MPGAPAAETLSDHERRRNVLLVYALSAVSTAGAGSMNFVLPLNLDRLGHPLSLVGTIVALIGLGSLISRLPGGVWYRLHRARWLNVASFALMGGSTIALGLGDDALFQAIFAGLHGFAFGLLSTILLALLIDIRPREESAATVMSWYTAAISAGYVLSSLIGAQSVERFGYGPAFIVSGLVTLAGAVLSFALRLPREAPASARSDQHGPSLPVGRFSAVLSLPSGVWLGTLLAFYLTFLANTYQTFHPIYAVGIGISVGTIGVLKLVHSSASTTVRFAGAALFRVVPVGVVNHVMAVTMALGTISLAFVTGEAQLIVIFAILGACRGLLRVTSATIVAEERRRPGAGAGLVSGIYSAGSDIADLFGPALAGALAAALSIPTTLVVVGLTLPAIYYGLWFAVRIQRSRRPATSPALGGSEPRSTPSASAP